MSRYVFLIVFLLFSNFAHSSEYVWKTDARFPASNPMESCQAYVADAGKVFCSLNQVTDRQYTCRYNNTSCSASSGFSSKNTTRSGDTCPTNSIYNPETGICTVQCPEGQTSQNGQCVATCPAGYTPDPLNPALCGHDCPTGATPNEQGSCACPSSSISFMDSNNNLQGCSEPDPEEDNCKTAWDVISKFECGKKKEECEAQGGTFGFVNEKSTCLPAGFGDDLPTCEQGYVIVDYGNEAGGVVCGSANKPPVTPPNNSNAHAPVTGDGSKNHDGIGNNTNGDGGAGSGSSETVCKSNPNLSPNDPACTAKETKSNNSSNGGSGCGQPPSCSGDPILCNILKQSYENKCALNTFDPSTLGTQDTAEGLQEEVDIEDTIAGIFEDDGVTSACPPPVTFRFTSTPFSYRPMCDLAEYIRPFVIMIFSYFAARLIHRSMMEI